jgi:PAS domain S-box-containing protein
MTGELERYREQVRETVDRALLIIAQISYGELDIKIEPPPPDDDFADVLYGLGHLSADLRDARREIDEHGRALRQANANLEAQVRARTSELERTNERLAADIARREQAEAQVRESEAKYRGLVETSPDPILLTDGQGAIVMANPAACVAFRASSAAALVAEPLVSLVTPEDRLRGEQHFAALRTGRAVQSAELYFTRTDQTAFLAEVRSCLVEDGPGGHPLALSIVRDVTEKRQRELEALRAQKLQSVGTLAGGIAHDFNNVLTSITGALQVAARYTAHQPAVAELVSSAIEAAFRATGLTKQLLTFSKGGAPVKTCMRVHEVVEHAVTFCLRGSSVKSQLDLPADLWPVEIDHGQLEQAFVNLVINAKQAMPSGGLLTVCGENVVAVRPGDDAASEHRFVRIAFRDTGVGIALENLQKIFDPYFTTKEGGTGLGLATTYFVVKQHAGFVRCESTPGRGATFHVFLPASDKTPSPSSSPPKPAGRAKGRILVMDDDPKVRAVVELLLRDVGYETVGTASGTDALEVYLREQAAGRPFAVVIMDLTVPGGDGGKETIGKLLAVDKDARVVVVSGYSNDPVLADHRRYGFAGMLTKPFRAEALLSLVQSLLAGDTVRPRADLT